MSEPILILTECGADIGFGHLTRCMSVAEGFRNVGMNAEVWAAVDESLTHSLPSAVRPIRWYGLPGELKAEVACAYSILLDSYRIDVDEIERISTINGRIAVIDDFPHRQYTTGVVIDSTIGAEKYAFPSKCAGVSYLLGSGFCALRPEFNRVAERKFCEFPRSILVTFGGSDIRSLTLPVVTMLQQKFPAMEKLVVVGSAFPKMELYSLENSNTSFYTAVDGDLMQKLMARADIAICGGGQTLYELASQGLPPVTTCLIENQKHDIRGFTQAGFGIDIGSWQRPDLPEAIATGICEIWPVSVRERHSAVGRRCVDGRGAERLAIAILAKWKCLVAHD